VKSLDERIRNLPPALKKEVEEFVVSLERRRRKKPHGKLKMDWAGALSDLRDKYTSVDLQHKISEWRIGER
jgi:hypothetical protein